MSNSIRLWDLPTRLFHWSLAVCVIGLIVTGQVGGDAMTWHFRLGYAVLALVLFRIAWGFVGGRWSRFSAFVPTPARLWHYLRGHALPELSIGHNPLGALSVLAMLLFLLLQVTTGLVSDDEIATAGPLTHLVPSALVSQATSYHKHVGKLILFALVLLHLAAIAYYLLRRRDNLIRPMLTGDKEVDGPLLPSRDDGGIRLLAAGLLAACAAAVGALLRFAG